MTVTSIGLFKKQPLTEGQFLLLSEDLLREFQHLITLLSTVKINGQEFGFTYRPLANPPSLIPGRNVLADADQSAAMLDFALPNANPKEINKAYHYISNMLAQLFEIRDQLAAEYTRVERENGFPVEGQSEFEHVGNTPVITEAITRQNTLRRNYQLSENTAQYVTRFIAIYNDMVCHPLFTYKPNLGVGAKIINGIANILTSFADMFRKLFGDACRGSWRLTPQQQTLQGCYQQITTALTKARTQPSLDNTMDSVMIIDGDDRDDDDEVVLDTTHKRSDRGGDGKDTTVYAGTQLKPATFGMWHNDASALSATTPATPMTPMTPNYDGFSTPVPMCHGPMYTGL